MYKPEWFTVEELFPQDMCKKYPESLLWRLMDDRILITADRMRKYWGKMIANTWKWGGKHQYRGFRPWEVGVGARYSQHKFGRAIDLIPVTNASIITVDTIRDSIIEFKKGRGIDRTKLRRVYEYITVIEAKVPWLHLACENSLNFKVIKVR